jgi:hypothetical protein
MIVFVAKFCCEKRSKVASIIFIFRVIDFFYWNKETRKKADLIICWKHVRLCSNGKKNQSVVDQLRKRKSKYLHINLQKPDKKP